jgi:hypothetical protein
MTSVSAILGNDLGDGWARNSSSGPLRVLLLKSAVELFGGRPKDCFSEEVLDPSHSIGSGIALTKDPLHPCDGVPEFIFLSLVQHCQQSLGVDFGNISSNTKAVMHDPGRVSGLIKPTRKNDHRHALKDRFAYGTQTAMGDKGICMAQQLQLWDRPSNDNMTWQGAQILRIQSIAHVNDGLPANILRQCRDDGSEKMRAMPIQMAVRAERAVSEPSGLIDTGPIKIALAPAVIDARPKINAV